MIATLALCVMMNDWTYRLEVDVGKKLDCDEKQTQEIVMVHV